VIEPKSTLVYLANGVRMNICKAEDVKLYIRERDAHDKELNDTIKFWKQRALGVN